MNHIFENNNSKKKEAEEKSINYCKPEKRLKDGGFVAWPGNKLLTSQESSDIEISTGRLKDGGYVAYPKNKS